MLAPLSLCALAIPQATDEEPPAAPPLSPQLVLQVPDIGAAWTALQDSAWARLLAEEALLSALRPDTADAEATLSELWADAIEDGRVDAGFLQLLELLAGLRSATVGVAFRPGSIDAPRNEWRLAEMLRGGQIVLVLDVENAASIDPWRETIDAQLARPGARTALGDAAAEWSVAGTRAVLRVGDLSSVLSVDALVTEGADRPPTGDAADLPVATGGVLANVWVAPFHELHLYESEPIGIAIARVLGLIVGPQAGFIGGSGRMRISITDGMLVIDEVRELLPPESGDFLGRAPVAREAIELAHPEAWLATVASVDRDALEAALEESFGEATASDFVALLGDALAISAPPIRGIGQIPPVFLAAHHREPDAMTAVVARMAERAVLAQGGRVTLERRAYRGAELFVFSAAPDVVPPGLEAVANLLRPTVAVTEDRILATTAPVAMKKEIRRLRKASATHAGLARIVAPEGATAITYVDWGDVAARGYSIFVSLSKVSGMIDERSGGLAQLPWPELIRRHFRPGFRWSVVADGVRVTRSEASMDPMEALFVVLCGTAFVLCESAAAQMEQTTAQIALVELAVQTYLLEHQACPPSLGAAYPGSAPPLDAWGRPFVYRPLGDFEFDVYSAGPNGVDEGGTGDDVTRPD
ncbi:MAG: type II secretion system protein GspG [Planctomycetota bacterium]